MSKATSKGKGRDRGGAGDGSAPRCPECRRTLSAVPARAGPAIPCSHCGPAVRRPSARVQVF